MLQPSLYNKFKEKDINKKAVTIVTQVKVDKDDPAFKNPTKPVGPFYSKEKVEKLQKEKGWTIIEDSGRVAANKIFDLTGESPVLAIYPFRPSSYTRHAER